MKQLIIVVSLLLLCSVVVLAVDEVAYVVELNTQNTVDYVEGQTIELATKVLYGPFAQNDVSCGVLAVDEAGNVALQYSPMNYNEIEEHYDYYWVPTPAPESFWESIYHTFFPTTGTYVAVINCTGGAYDSNLTDNVVVRVVSQ